MWLFSGLPKHPVATHPWRVGLLLSVATRSQYKQAAATLPMTCVTGRAKALFKTVKGTLAFPPLRLIKGTWGSRPAWSMSVRETHTCVATDFLAVLGQTWTDPASIWWKAQIRRLQPIFKSYPLWLRYLSLCLLKCCRSYEPAPCCWVRSWTRWSRRS